MMRHGVDVVGRGALHNGGYPVKDAALRGKYSEETGAPNA